MSKNYDIQVVDIKPGDTLLIHVSNDIDLGECASIHEELSKVYPECKILLCNEWILKGMTILRQAEYISPICDEVIIDKPLDELYPDLFGQDKGSAVKPGEILW